MNYIYTIKQILLLKNIAVVGISPKKQRPSYFVSSYMKQNGYNIIPINPNYKMIDNLRCYPSLESVKTTIDTVAIFRRSEFVMPIIKSAIYIKAKAIWMQDNVINKNAENVAKAAGLMVIMNDCMLRQYQLKG
tara:strand:- start:384 stop:782 length:399 start_codon:yes stop_codon:yes gene_type:complete